MMSRRNTARQGSWDERTRAASRRTLVIDQEGFALPVVLAFIAVGTIITVAVLAFATTSMKVGRATTDRNDRISAERDALEYTLAVVRDDLSKGREGQTETRTVAGETATCTGQPGSGVISGAGRTDRVVECTTSSITTTVRFFDRSGDGPGVIEETLTWDVKG